MISRSRVPFSPSMALDKLLTHTFSLRHNTQNSIMNSIFSLVWLLLFSRNTSIRVARGSRYDETLPQVVQAKLY